jgi:aerotaxis receptor
MRDNQPVSHQEYLLQESQTLVSVTDLKGRITYCNPAFIEVSGFTRDELLGQPHNIVRHPDMPEEAFRDLWGTIQAGLPWQGLVKNRRKNGDHYWVQANATPMMDGDQITGFLSVRTTPTREQVNGAEALYARMRDEASTGQRRHVLHRGQMRRGRSGGPAGAGIGPADRGPAAADAAAHGRPGGAARLARCTRVGHCAGGAGGGTGPRLRPSAHSRWRRCTA